MRFLRRLLNLCRMRAAEAELAEEMEFHREMMRLEFERTGLSGKDAALAANRAMGNMMAARENARCVWLPVFCEGVMQDCAYAVRSLRRQPGFALIAAGTLAVAIGLNTSVFTVFSAAAFRPWPVRDPGRVVTVYRLASDAPQGGNNIAGFSLAEARFLDLNSESFEGVAAMRNMYVRLASDGAGSRSTALIVTGNYFRVLGVRMERGRGFMPAEDVATAPEAVAVLSYSTWQNRLAGDPDIVGKQIRIDGVPFTVVGVVSRDFAGTMELRADVWAPFSSLRLLRPLDASVSDLLEKPDNCCFHAFGRIRAGISRDQARAELELVSRRFHVQHSLKPDPILLRDTTLLSQPGAKRAVTVLFTLMFAGALLVLMLACANVGNLLIARAAARREEIATRLSIGASRARIVRQLLTESLLLAVGATLAGIFVAYVLPPFVIARATDTPPNLRLQPDWTVAVFSAVLAAITTILFGLAPSLQATRMNLTAALRGEAPGSRVRLRSVLLGVQAALSVLLLVSAGLMMRGVHEAARQDPGIPVNTVAVISFDLPASSYNRPRIRAFLAGVEEGLRSLAVPGSYAFARTAPFTTAHWWESFRFRGENPNRARLIETQEIGAGYFNVLGLPFVAGRPFDASDADGAVVVNEAMARRYLGGREAIGQEIILGGNEKRQIVGIVKDAYTTRLESIDPLVYKPLSGREMPELLIRSSPAAAFQTASAIARRLDPRIQVRAEPLRARLERSLSPARTGSALASMLGLLALGLASVGIAGVAGYLVRQRTREIGIRVALGAKPAHIVAVVLGGCAGPLFTGLMAGFVMSAAAVRLIRSFLYGLNAFDLVTYAAVCSCLITAAVAAILYPATRALRIEPVSVLRYE